MSSQNDPIKMLATFDDKAIPMAGLKVPAEKFVGRNRSSIEPIRMLSNNEDGIRDLSKVVLAKIKAVAEASLSANEAAIVRTWIEGLDEHAAATRLNWTADAVRAAREQLLRRIHVTIDPPST